MKVWDRVELAALHKDALSQCLNDVAQLDIPHNASVSESKIDRNTCNNIAVVITQAPSISQWDLTGQAVLKHQS